MGLPVVELPRGVALVGDVEVPVRGLSRVEAGNVTSHAEEDPERAEALALAYGTDTPESEVEAWLQATPVGVVNAVVDQILKLSGLSEDSGKE